MYTILFYYNINKGMVGTRCTTTKHTYNIQVRSEGGRKGRSRKAVGGLGVCLCWVIGSSQFLILAQIFRPIFLFVLNSSDASGEIKIHLALHNR